MKCSIITAAVISSALFSCSQKEQIQTDTNSNLTFEAPKTTAPAPEAEGKSLLEGADCLSCHKVDAKLVGPSYQEIAAKYTEADMNKLAQIIIDGGKGKWGDIPMTPHPGMSKENAQKMVKYILSLKK